MPGALILGPRLSVTAGRAFEIRHSLTWLYQDSVELIAATALPFNLHGQPMQISTSMGGDQCIRVSLRFMCSNLDCITPERKTRRRIYGSDLNHASTSFLA